MVLQTAPEICELNGRDWSGDAAVLFGMKFVFAGIHQNTVAVNVALIIDGLVRLPAIVESDWVGPNILLALAHLLSIVLPVNAVPEKIVVDAVFEAGPDSGARIGRRARRSRWRRRRGGRRYRSNICDRFARSSSARSMS